MKKTLLIMVAMLFVAAVGTGYGAGNGVTDFTGKSYDLFAIDTVTGPRYVEQESAGGKRAGEQPLYNGVTDFTGRSHDLFAITPGAGKTVEGIHAGGFREGQPVNKAARSGVGSTRSYEQLPMHPALGWE